LGKFNFNRHKLMCRCLSGTIYLSPSIRGAAALSVNISSPVVSLRYQYPGSTYIVIGNFGLVLPVAVAHLWLSKSRHLRPPDNHNHNHC